MPNLDNLRKQAKQFLRWHRDRHYPVAAEIRAALPRFRDLNDRQILDAPFRLGDAQEIVARRLGYENWTALKAGVSAMPISEVSGKPISDKPELSKPVLGATEAVIYVSDFRRARDFYISKLGFPSNSTTAIRPSTGSSSEIARVCACGSFANPCLSATFGSVSNCLRPGSRSIRRRRSKSCCASFRHRASISF